MLTGITKGADVLSQLPSSTSSSHPRFGGVFIAGFLAPRASWLLGVIVGLVSAICYTILGFAGLLPAGFAEVFALEPSAAIVSSFVFSPIMGALFASAAASYAGSCSCRARDRHEAAGAPRQRRPEPLDVRPESGRTPLTVR